MSRTKGSIKIPDQVKGLIEREALMSPSEPRRDVALRLHSKLEKMGYSWQLETLEREVSKFRAPIDLDAPWSLGVRMPELPPEATKELLKVWKYSLGAPNWKFTIREAIWVARLREVLGGEGPETIWKWAMLYARRELTAQHRSRPLNTEDLDAELAFQPSKSELNRWEYDQALATATIKTTSTFGLHPSFLEHHVPTAMYVSFPIPFSDYLGHGRRFLREVGGFDIDSKSWWSHAENVMAFWLREISVNVNNWMMVARGIGSDTVPSAEEKEAWNDMGRRLAAMIIEEAQRLEEWESAWEATRDERERFYDKTWRVQLDIDRAMKAGNLREAYSLYDQINELRAQESELLHGLRGYTERWRPTKLLEEVGYVKKGDSNEQETRK